MSFIHPHLHILILGFLASAPVLTATGIFSILQKATSTLSANFLSLNNSVSFPTLSLYCSGDISSVIE